MHKKCGIRKRKMRHFPRSCGGMWGVWENEVKNISDDRAEGITRATQEDLRAKALSLEVFQ